MMLKQYQKCTMSVYTHRKVIFKYTNLIPLERISKESNYTPIISNYTTTQYDRVKAVYIIKYYPLRDVFTYNTQP